MEQNISRDAVCEQVGVIEISIRQMEISIAALRDTITKEAYDELMYRLRFIESDAQSFRELL